MPNCRLLSCCGHATAKSPDDDAETTGVPTNAVDAGFKVIGAPNVGAAAVAVTGATRHARVTAGSNAGRALTVRDMTIKRRLPIEGCANRRSAGFDRPGKPVVRSRSRKKRPAVAVLGGPRSLRPAAGCSAVPLPWALPRPTKPGRQDADASGAHVVTRDSRGFRAAVAVAYDTAGNHSAREARHGVAPGVVRRPVEHQSGRRTPRQADTAVTHAPRRRGRRREHRALAASASPAPRSSPAANLQTVPPPRRSSRPTVSVRRARAGPPASAARTPTPARTLRAARTSRSRRRVAEQLHGGAGTPPPFFAGILLDVREMP